MQSTPERPFAGQATLRPLPRLLHIALLNLAAGVAGTCLSLPA